MHLRQGALADSRSRCVRWPLSWASNSQPQAGPYRPWPLPSSCRSWDNAASPGWYLRLCIPTAQRCSKVFPVSFLRGLSTVSPHHSPQKFSITDMPYTYKYCRCTWTLPVRRVQCSHRPQEPIPAPENPHSTSLKVFIMIKKANTRHL